MQTLIPLGSGKGALRLTTARYYTPSGHLSRPRASRPTSRYSRPAGRPEVANRHQGRGVAARSPQGGGRRRSGSQSYVPPDEKDDKALKTALDLLRGATTDAAFPPNPKAAVPN